MNYWSAQTIVQEYSCPVQMMSQLLNILSAKDIFEAKREDVRELQEFCDILSEVCEARKQTDLKNLARHLVRS